MKNLQLTLSINKKQNSMKKITSIFSLVLFSALTLSLSSCNDCEGGEGNWNPGAQGITIDQLEQKLADAAKKLVALSSDGTYLLTYDPVEGKWYYATPDGNGGYNKKEVETPPVTDSKSGSLNPETNGIYINYTDGKGDVQTLYLPEFKKQDDGTTKITVGGVEYIIPKACGCTISVAEGQYTISDGKGNEFKSYAAPKWVNTVTVSYNGSNFEIAKADDPTKKVEIPNGFSSVTIDETSGVATITASDGSKKSLQLQLLQSVVKNSTTNPDKAVTVTTYKQDGTVDGTYELPQYGEFTALTSKVDGIDTRLKTVESQVGDWDPAKHKDRTITQVLDSINNVVDSLDNRIECMFDSLAQAIAASITNIQVEEVMSNAIGSYNGIFTNMKTTKLVGYFGTTDEIAFPSIDPVFFKDAGEPAMTNSLGEIQLTVNPIQTDFRGVSVSLVNSLGKPSRIKLSDLESSEKLLMTGFTGNTRADDYSGTGFYKTTATITADDLNCDTLRVAIDKSAVKDAVKSAWHDLKDVYNQRRLGAVQGETVNKVANAIYNVLSGISTERLAVKTEWTQTVKDPVSGNKVSTTKSIVSPYDLSGVIVKPLGFESLPEQYRDSLRVFKKAKKLIKNLNTRIAKKIINMVEKEADLAGIKKQIDTLQIQLKDVKLIPDSMKIIKQTVNIDTTVNVKVGIDYKTPVNINKDIAITPVKVAYTLPKNFRIIDDPLNPGQKKIVYDESSDTTTVNVDTINFVYADTIAIKDSISSNVRFWITREFAVDISSMVDNVNNTLKLVQSLDGLCNSAQKIINNIYKYENKLLAGNYLNGIYKFIDKASAYSAQGIYKLFQPVLLVNSDKGFGFAGIRGVPAKVTGTVEVIPTTYSNGLVAPVYKKYIRVNGGKGKVLDEGQVSLDITSQLNPGANIVEYYAIDFYGNEIGEEYVIIME